MLRNGHVRFGRRPAETHQPQDWHGAAGRPHTEHWTDEGKLYECAIKDVWSNRIVGYSISDQMKSKIAVDALTMAVAGEMRWQAASCTATAAVQGGFNLVPPISPVA